MNTLILISQLIVAFGILNVWLIRAGNESSWRGGDSRNMKEEFRVYGLPESFVYIIGFVKVTLALLLIGGIWFPAVVQPAALAMAVLMLAAVAMHVKVKDTLKKSLPAFILLSLSLFLASA